MLRISHSKYQMRIWEQEKITAATVKGDHAKGRDCKYAGGRPRNTSGRTQQGSEAEFSGNRRVWMHIVLKTICVRYRGFRQIVVPEKNSFFLKSYLFPQGSYLLASSNDFASRIWTVDDNRLRVSGWFFPRFVNVKCWSVWTWERNSEKGTAFHIKTKVHLA